MPEAVKQQAAVEEQPLEMSKRRRWAVTAGVMTGMFLAALEATVVSTAMPTVIASLGGLSHYSWVFSAYLITSTVTVPVWGKLSDLYGRRLFYQLGIAVFLLGSILSGMSTSMTQLIAFRAIQGLGAGALIPLGMTIIGDIYTLQERARMQALFSGVWGFSSVIGPVAGGFITDQLSWRWVFYINIPVGLAAALIMGLALKEPRRHQRPAIDYAGAAVLMIAITLLMLALVEGGASVATLTSPQNLALFASAILLTALFVWIELRERPYRAVHALPQPRGGRLHRHGLPCGRGHVRGHHLRAALRSGRFGLYGYGGRLAFDAAHAELGRDVRHRRAPSAARGLQTHKRGRLYTAHGRTRPAGEL